MEPSETQVTGAADLARAAWDGITEGRIVHVRRGEGRCQAAIVVRNWSEGTANLLVFRDGSNDYGIDGLTSEVTRWATSVQHESKVVSTTQEAWHWPERV